MIVIFLLFVYFAIGGVVYAIAKILDSKRPTVYQVFDNNDEAYIMFLLIFWPFVVILTIPFAIAKGMQIVVVFIYALIAGGKKDKRMTNGELFFKTFPCLEQDEKYPNILWWTDEKGNRQILGDVYDSDFWNAEYKESTTENNLAQERYQDLIKYFGDEKVAKTILKDRKEFKAWLERVKWHVKRVDELARELEQLKATTPNDCETCIHNKGVLECDIYGCKYEPTTKNDIIHCQHTDEEIEKSFIENAEAVKDQLLIKNDLGVKFISKSDVDKIIDCPYFRLDDKLIQIMNLPSVTFKDPCEHDNQKVLNKIRVEIKQITSRYSISRERGGMGQVEWSDNLIKESEVLKILDKYKTEIESQESEDKE